LYTNVAIYFVTLFYLLQAFRMAKTSRSKVLKTARQGWDD